MTDTNFLESEKLANFTQYDALEIKNPNDEDALLGILHKKTPAIIDDYTNWSIIVLIGFELLALIPILLIHFLSNYSNLFSKLWWVLLGSFTLLIVLSVVCYIYRQKILRWEDFRPYYLYTLYVLLCLTMNVAIALFSSHIGIAMRILMLFSLTVILISNKISILRTKYWIKLSIIFSFMIIFMLAYIIISNEKYVELFIINIFVVFYISYLALQIKSLYIEFYEDKLIGEKGFSIKVTFMGIIIANVDLFLFTFK